VRVQEGSRAPVIAPHPGVARVAGLIMVASVVFLIVGDRPVIANFFGTSDEELRVQYLLDAPDDWDWAMTMYAVMGVVVAVGFALWAVAVHLGSADRTSRRIADVGATSAALGALAWVIVCYLRATRPPAEVAAGDAEWSLLAWAPLVMVAVGLVGWMLHRADMRARMGDHRRCGDLRSDRHHPPARRGLPGRTHRADHPRDLTEPMEVERHHRFDRSRHARPTLTLGSVR
jgi:hypothetical protein